MHRSISRRSLLKLVGAAALGTLLPSCQLPDQPIAKIPARLKNEVHMWINVSDYTYLWWANGLRDPQRIFNIQTSRFGLSFDAEKFNLRKLGAFSQTISEAEALIQNNDIIEGLPDVSLEAALEMDGKRFKVIGAVNDPSNHQLIESGKYFQRRWQRFLIFETGAPVFQAADSGLEVSAWPDRMALILRLIADQPIEKAVLEITLQVPPEYLTPFATGEGRAWVNKVGSGYAFLTYSPEASLKISDQKAIVRMEVQNWQQGEQRSVGIIIYPVQNAVQALTDAVALENSALQVEAKQIFPAEHTLDVTYHRETGWYAIGLRNDGDISEYAESSNDRFEQVVLSIHNPGDAPRIVRLNFAKDGQVFGITGISAILRDTDHNPLGIPIQLSKNWHVSAPKATVPKRFEGPWFHGLTMLTIPPGETITLDYVSVNALWGKLPAASHAQLCLVGWGIHQLWEQAAIGAWGESLCFEPDQGHNCSAVLDTRPLMVNRISDEGRWGWTNNVGGADFLVYYDADADQQRHSRMKTRHRRNCPNLTEAIYTGTTHDQKIDLQYTISLYRTDDINRGVYKFRYDIKEKTPFLRLILFQCGADNYSYTGERKFAYGDETGLLKEWDTQWGGGAYRTERIEWIGRIPWISMHEAVRRSPGGAWANRGLVLRKWEARLGGKRVQPWFAERGAFVQGVDTSLIDILPPPGVTELLPGDCVEAEIVHVVMPQFAAYYYGPNENLRQALSANENTWKMILREAVGNHLEVKVRRGGDLTGNYPIHIRSRGGEVFFSVTGGLGYVPVTISGLEDYRGFRLEQQVNGAWVEIDQSHYGKDFWQTDFDPVAQRWELTYNLPRDTPQDQPQRREYRLVRAKT